ncbi:TetR/AcrR family transcriptional regulator [Tepidibacter sp. Z1-5]|uniref:TetR/AcrR family transcriptional regulator n=1 Tax=Tepidibacter sp. Z1-5 TaxID=3134138 RepID=UPI0030BD5031
MSDLRKAKGEETRIKIINSTIDIISFEGISQISTKRIADMAGISKSNLFHHFSSIQDIIESVVYELCNNMDVFADGDEFNSLEETFERIGEQILGGDAHLMTYYRVMIALSSDMSYHECFKELLERQQNETIQLVKSVVFAVEKTHLSDDLAELLVLDIEGLVKAYLRDEDKEKYKRYWDIKSQMYIRDFRTQN